MSLRQRSIKAVAWSGLQSWGGQLVNLLVFTIMARSLAPADWGLVAMATVFLALIRVFVDQGLGQALVQRDELEPEHVNTAFLVSSVLGLVLTLACIAGAGLIAALFDEPQLRPIVSILALTLFINSLGGVHIALLQRALDFRPLALRTLAATLVGGAVGVTMALAGMGVWALVGFQLAMSLTQLVMLWWFSRWRPSLAVSRRHFCDLFGYGANVLGINLLEYVNRQADNFLIGLTLGPVALGYYNIACRLFQILVGLLTGVTSTVAFASFSSMQKQPERMRKAFYEVTQLVSLISFPVFAGLCVLAGPLLVALFSDQWILSIPVLQVLALVGILESVYYFNANVMMAMGKPSWRLKLNLLSAVANVIAFALAVRYGIVAVAAAYVARAWLLSPLPLLAVQRLIDIGLGQYLKNLTPAAISALSMSAFLLMLRSALPTDLGPWQVLAWCIPAGVVSYAACLCWLDWALVKRFLATAGVLRSRKPDQVSGQEPGSNQVSQVDA